MKRVEIGLRIAVFAALMMSLVTAALAQAPPAGADKQEMMAKLEKLSTELQLTPAQKKQVGPILMQEAPKLKAIKANTSLGPMQKAMQLKQIGEDTDAKMKPILTPEQYQKFQQIRQQEREQMMQQMRGPQ